MSKDKDDFAHLHTHSDYSSLDGACKIDDYVDEAVKRGNPAIAITDHGTCRGILKLHEATKDKPIKPIYGCEFYVSQDMHRKGLTDDEKKEITKGLPKNEHRAAIKRYEDENGIRDRWHTTVIAENEVGLRNLYRLSSNSYVDGFYYKSRIDLDELEKYKEGLIITTGCLSSPVNDSILQGRERAAYELADRLYQIAGENLYLELQPHAIRDQRVTNKFALDLYERFDKKAKFLATQDAHYLARENAEHHEVLLCIGTGSLMSDPDRFKFDGDEFHMRTRKEMFAAFRRHHDHIPAQVVKQALNSTLEIAERCSAKVHVDYKAALLPRPEVPGKYEENDFQYLKDLCLDGWKWRDIEKRARDIAARRGLDFPKLYREYADRLKHELRALKTQKFVPYFLLVREIYAFARTSDIMIGPGRGSVGGSLIAYLLGITIVDPIEHGLIFERFINPFRFDLPDVDMDFEDRRRHEIIEWLIKRFGRENVSQIATIGKLSGKACIKDVSRVLEVPLREVMQVTSSIIERSSGDERASQTIEDSFKDFEVCREFDKRHPKVLYHARHLEGLSKTLGIHAAGVVTSPVPLATLMPMEIRKHNGEDVIVTAYDMYGVAAMGLAKLDVLGLRTLTVIKEALQAIKLEHGVEIDFESPDFNLNDPKVLQAFTDHDYGGVFQYDTPSADKICAGVKFSDFEDIAAMTALNRPGTARSGLATKYVERKKNPKLVEKVDFHPLVSKITSDTLGIIVYQEHVIKIFTDCAGFAPGTADSLRKTIAKKIGDETIGRERASFVEGCAKHSGIDAPTANKIMDAITFFGCVCADSEVLTPGGPRRIDSLKPGEEILSSDEAVHKTRAYQREDTSQTNRVQACGLPISFLEEWFSLRGGKNGSEQVGAGTQIGLEEVWPYLEAWRNNPPQGRESVEQLSRQLGSLDARSAHDLTQACIQGSALLFKGLQEEGILQKALQSLLPGGVQEASPEAWDGCWIQEDGQGSNGQESSEFEIPDGKSGVAASSQGASNPSVIRNRIKAIGRSGFKHVWELMLDNGACVYATLEHWFATPTGFKKLGSILVGEQVYTGIGPSCVESIAHVGEREVWDLECENSDNANYFVRHADSEQWLISHNSYGFNKSHATEYGMISYWTMYLKVYYPLEFYWALLKNEPDRIRIAAYAKQAKKHGIELLPPHVNVSKTDFVIDRAHNAIRGSLVDIKGVGPGAAETIMENQPFKDWFDMQDRINKAKVHRGVNIALAKAGALKGLVPSTKWYLDNIEEIWKIKDKKRQRKELVAMFEAAKGAEDFNDEDMALQASSVNPLAFGKHPIDAYKEFIERVIKFESADMSSDSFFDDHGEKPTFITGVILEVKYNQIGDFHTGAAPTEDEKKEMFWGARYANVNIESEGGKQNRCKFDFDIFDEHRPTIDAGVGTPVMVHVIPNSKFQNLRAQFVVNLAQLRERMKDCRALNVWERIVTGTHPALSYAWKDKDARHRAVTNEKFKASPIGGVVVGVVTNVRLKYDKNGNLMAFFGLIGADGFFIDVIAFSSIWEYVGRAIKQGYLVKCIVEKKPDRMRGWSYFCGEKVKVLSKPFIGEPT